MTTRALARAIGKRKPAIIRERGVPRYVLLDWKAYREWEDLQEDLEDRERLIAALEDPKNQKRMAFVLKNGAIDIADIFLKKGRGDYRRRT